MVVDTSEAPRPEVACVSASPTNAIAFCGNDGCDAAPTRGTLPARVSAPLPPLVVVVVVVDAMATPPSRIKGQEEGEEQSKGGSGGGPKRRAAASDERKRRAK